MRLASEAQLAMQHRYRCALDQLTRVDALPPSDEPIARQRYLCRSCGLYLTGTQLTEQECTE